MKPDRRNSTPNILWICTDSQRYDTLGCYGNEFVCTPNIDKLASRGLLFEQAYAVNPLCTPSRGNFLTGRYPVTNRLRQNGQCIPESELPVTRILAENGYVCGLSGKLHLSACDRRFTLGDDWWKLPREKQVVQGVERRINDGYTEFYWDHAPSGLFPESSYTKWVGEKGGQIEYPDRDDSENVKHGMPAELHQTTFCVEKAMDFIERHNDSPWLFSVNIFDPHFTVNPPDKYLERYLGKLEDIPLPSYIEGELENKPSSQRKRAERFKDYTEHEHRMMRAGYWAMCDLIDAQLGRLFDLLEKTGQDENTIIIYTSDHGELLGDHGQYIKGSMMYDCSMRVPLIISWPGRFPEGERTQAMVELGDLAPTVLDAAGIERHPGMQAKSLWPLLTGETHIGEFRKDVYGEYFNSNPDDVPEYRTMVRNRKYKIISSHGGEPGELYDMENDPGENRNLWNHPEYSEIKIKMLERVADRLAETCDPLPPRIGIY